MKKAYQKINMINYHLSEQRELFLKRVESGQNNIAQKLSDLSNQLEKQETKIDELLALIEKLPKDDQRISKRSGEILPEYLDILSEF